MVRVKNLRESRAFIQYIQSNYRNPPAMNFRDLSLNQINSEIKRIMEQHYPDVAPHITQKFQNYIQQELIDDDLLGWINPENNRLINLLCFAVCTAGQNANAGLFQQNQMRAYFPIPVSREERYLTIIKTIDTAQVPAGQYGQPIQYSLQTLENLNMLWEERKPLEKFYDSFFYKDEDKREEKSKWAWSYAKKKGWIHPAIVDNSEDSSTDLVIMTIDCIPGTATELESKFKEMRNAWNQKVHKTTKTGDQRKNYGISLSEESVRKLDEVKKFRNTSRTTIIEAMIESAHRKMEQEKAQMAENILGDDFEL